VRYFVVPDLHGNLKALRVLLDAEGLLTEDGQRRKPKTVTVVQLGDAANCVGESFYDDITVLERVGTWIDVMLVGNHEYPYWDGGAFSGFYRLRELGKRLHKLERDGFVLPSFCANGILLTHAGVTASALSILRESGFLRPGKTDSLSVHEALFATWKRDPTDAVFDQVGWRRGGWSTEGGVLWADAEEKRVDIEKGQVFGHTPGGNKSLHGPSSWCIDLGVDVRRHAADGIMGAWIEKEGAVRIVSHKVRT
jgi:hypothetical protein